MNYFIKLKKLYKSFTLLLIFTAIVGCTMAPEKSYKIKESKNIHLKTMGSLTFSGNVYTEENGETFHGDHGYAQYYVPEKSKNYPLVMWHGIGQSGKTWETTPDGRDGYMQIFTRRNWPVFIIDQPGRGRAGRSKLEFMDPSVIPTTDGESGMWNAFRLGEWKLDKGRKFFEGVQFSKDEESIDQFMRWQTPDAGVTVPKLVDNSEFYGKSVAKLFEKIGPGILLTHSASGGLGWLTGVDAPDLVKGIVAYEPGTFIFPEGEKPSEITSKNQLALTISEPHMVPVKEFEKLTKMPIMIVYGDNIYETDIFGIEFWRLSLERVKQFVDLINKHGGDATLVHLPEKGIYGNTHFPFADLNNIEIADQLSEFLHDKGLDKNDKPYKYTSSNNK